MLIVCCRKWNFHFFTVPLKFIPMLNRCRLQCHWSDRSRLNFIFLSSSKTLLAKSMVSIGRLVQIMNSLGDFVMRYSVHHLRLTHTALYLNLTLNLWSIIIIDFMLSFIYELLSKIRNLFVLFHNQIGKNLRTYTAKLRFLLFYILIDFKPSWSLLRHGKHSQF